MKRNTIVRRIMALTEITICEQGISELFNNIIRICAAEGFSWRNSWDLICSMKTIQIDEQKCGNKRTTTDDTL